MNKRGSLKPLRIPMGSLCSLSSLSLGGVSNKQEQELRKGLPSPKRTRNQENQENPRRPGSSERSGIPNNWCERSHFANAAQLKRFFCSDLQQVL